VIAARVDDQMAVADLSGPALACRLDHGQDVLIMVACARFAAIRCWMRLVRCPGWGDRGAAGGER